MRLRRIQLDHEPELCYAIITSVENQDDGYNGIHEAKSKPRDSYARPPTVQPMRRPALMSDQQRDVQAQRELLRNQLRFYRAEQQALAKALGFRLETHKGQKGLTIGELRRIPLSDSDVQRLRAGLELLTDADLRKRAREITEFIASTTQDLVRLHAQADKLAANASDEELQDTVRTLFMRSAHTFTPDEWALLDEVREKLKTDGARAAMLRMRDGLRAIHGDGAKHPALAQGERDESDDNITDGDER